MLCYRKKGTPKGEISYLEAEKARLAEAIETADAAKKGLEKKVEGLEGESIRPSSELEQAKPTAQTRLDEVKPSIVWRKTSASPPVLPTTNSD
ncbi:hypothetical protein FOPE_10912 [Fonsecaea pedrosoi]|nr:hypothetical protein FOPE_10912 [Fonsecaea pedrosoi]